MEFTKQWEELKTRYYEENGSNNPDSWYEELREAFEKLNVEAPEIQTVTADKTFAFVCPDTEWEFPDVFVLREDGFPDRQNYMNWIYDAICEYYKYSDFYDEIAGIMSDDLLAMCIVENNIPVVQWFKSADTEVLNVRKLRNDVY